MESTNFINPQSGLYGTIPAAINSCVTALAFGFINFVDSAVHRYNYYL